ncbi:MAG TPA: PilZ domain-containing protein [Myxococcaceae bacterium]|nr:PilZ domain-containing protein [Myxococcaceae bacterium]
MSADAPHSDEFTILAPKPAYSRSLMDQDAESSSLTDSLKALFAQAAAARPRLTADRRATPRLQVEVICVERFEGTRYLRTTYDLSTFGLSTQRGHVHPVGTELDLELQLPDESSRPLLLRAKVVGLVGRTGGMRMAFKHPSRDAVRRLHKFLFSRMEAQGEA